MNMESGIVDEIVGKNLEREMKRESDSIDDFEHLDHVASGGGLVDISGGNTVSLVDAAATKLERNLLDTTIIEGTTEKDNILKPVPATPPPSAEFGKFILDSSPTDSIEQKLASFADSNNYYNNQFNMDKSDEKVNKIDSKTTTMSFIQAERADDFVERGSFDKNLLKNNPGDIDLLLDQKKNTPYFHDDDHDDDDDDDGENKKDEILKPEKEQFSSDFGLEKFEETKKQFQDVDDDDDDDLLCEFKSSSVPPAAQDILGKDCFKDEYKLPVEKPSNKTDFPWNYSEDLQAPTKPLPPVPAGDYDSDLAASRDDDNNQVNESGDEEFESEIESSPVKIPSQVAATKLTKIQPQINLTTKQTVKSFVDDEIAPSQIFANMGLDAWFNPERLNKRVAALIYWRKPEETGIVFGGILGILLSLAYFSLISVFSYFSLILLTATFGFRIYKTVMQAVQKTSDGHPFKEILEYDLAVPAEKVHQVADVAVAHLNASVSELRRLFLIEDFIDSLKFGVVLWCLSYVGSWFNGMTLIIIGVVALFTLPKVYETNKVQIDQNLALVQAKINELTAKVKAAIPLGKKVEPTKEE